MDPTQSDTQEAPNTNTEQPTTPSVPPGVQARFDEMTAANHELRRSFEQSNQMNQELIAQLAQTAARSMPAPVAQPLPEGVDPAMASFFKQLLDQNAATIKQEVAAVIGNVKAQTEHMAFQQAAQGEDPEVVQLAHKLQGDWRRNGNTGWTSEDALIYARGVVAKKNANQQAKGRPNGDGNDALTTHSASAPNPVAANKLPPAKSEEELRRMTVNQRDAYWANRVGDSEIQY